MTTTTKTGPVACPGCSYRLPRAFEEGDVCPECGLERTARPVGGARAGAGRPVGKAGPTRTASVSLPETLWSKADQLIERRGLASRSALFAALLKRAR